MGTRLPRPIRVAVWLAAFIVVSSFVARFNVDIPGEPMTPDSLLGLLLAAAFACAAPLMIRRRETVAWLLAVGAAGFAAFRILGLLRALQGVMGALAEAIPRVWPWLVPATYIALLLAAIVAAMYAARKRETARPWVRVGVPAAAVAGVIGVAVVLTISAAAPTDLDLGRVAGRVALGFTVIAALIGAGRDLAGPMARAQQRLLDQPLAKRGSTIAVYGRLLRDELFPSATEQRRLAIEEERARLAADLHALVLPDLRRAAAAAAAAGASGEVAAVLRNALADIEQLMHSRQNVVLEQFGLGPALEWLAERVEERSDVRVSIEEPDTSWIGVGNRTLTEHMATDRQRAAFRVALLALDNVVRHAKATTATIEFGVAPFQFLAVTDDGNGMSGPASPPGNGGARPGRGLADMRAEAISTGATLEITSTDTGTRIEISWGRPDVNAGDPATTLAGNAAGPRPSQRRG